MFGFANPHDKPEPEHEGLNIAVRMFSRACLPLGYTVVDNIHDAPSSLDELKECMRVRGVLVWSGACEDTIFQCPEHNQDFRAWHDWTHYRYRLPFSIAGEAACIFVQCFQLLQEYGHDDETEQWVNLLLTDVIGQAYYRALNGAHVDNQLEFSLANRSQYLKLASRVCVELGDESATDAGAILLAETIFGRA